MLILGVIVLLVYLRFSFLLFVLTRLHMFINLVLHLYISIWKNIIFLLWYCHCILLYPLVFYPTLSFPPFLSILLPLITFFLHPRIKPITTVLYIHLCPVHTDQQTARNRKTWTYNNRHSQKTLINVKINNFLCPYNGWYKPVLKNWVDFAIV